MNEEKKNINVDFDEFHRLLRQAVGLRTQKAFAEKCGMTPQYLSRLLNEDVRPNAETLKSISRHAAGGVTLVMLMKACGYGHEKKGAGAKERMVPISKTDDGCYAVRIAAAEMDGFAFPKNGSAMASFELCASSVGEKANSMSLRAFAGSENPPKLISGEAVKIRNIKKAGLAPGYDWAAELDFSYEMPRFVQLIKTAAIAKEGEKACVIRVLPSAEDLMRFFPDAASPEFSEGPDYDRYGMYSEKVYRSREDAEPAWKQLLQSIRGIPRYGRMIEADGFEEGVGFYTDAIPEEGLKKACLTHGRTDASPEALAEIMAEETGFSFSFTEKNEDFPESRPCIMVSDHQIEYDGIDRATAMSACRKYACEACAPFYGAVWTPYRAELSTEADHKTDMPQAERMRQAMEEFAEGGEEQ